MIGKVDYVVGGDVRNGTGITHRVDKPFSVFDFNKYVLLAHGCKIEPQWLTDGVESSEI